MYNEDDNSLDISNDTELLQNLKITANVFLKENKFITNEPDFSNYSNEKFINWVENRNDENSNNLIQLMDKVKLEINFRSLLSGIYTLKDNDKHSILVFFLSSFKNKTSTIGVQIIKNIIGLMLLADCKELLLISPKELSSKSKEYIDTNYSSETDTYSVTTYTDDNFINIIKHSFTPEVLGILKNEEIKDFENKENISVNDLPRMSYNDALVKFYRGKKGDIFILKRKVTTGNTMLDEQIIYKRVI